MAGQMWRVVSVYRVITLAYAALLIIRDDRAFAHPAAGYAVLAIMACWTGVTVAAYRRPAGRAVWVISADLCVAAALVLSTRWIDTTARVNAGAPTLPAAWAAAPVLACAVAGGPWADLAGVLLISAADLAARLTLSTRTVQNHVQSTLTKLQLHNKAQLVRYALENGMD